MADKPDQANAPVISLAAARAEFDRGSALFVDVRNYDVYRRSHIPGSISFPLKELFRRLQELPSDRRIIFC